MRLSGPKGVGEEGLVKNWSRFFQVFFLPGRYRWYALGPSWHLIQRSPGTLSETLSEPLLECHFPLRVAGPVVPNRVAP